MDCDVPVSCQAITQRPGDHVGGLLVLRELLAAIPSSLQGCIHARGFTASGAGAVAVAVAAASRLGRSRAGIPHFLAKLCVRAARLCNRSSGFITEVRGCVLLVISAKAEDTMHNTMIDSFFGGCTE